MTSNNNSGSTPVEQAIEIAIRLGLIFLLAVLCLNILNPFISLVLWSGVIAIALSKPFQSLEKKLGGSRKMAVTVFIVAGLALVLVPSIMLSGSLFDSITTLGRGISEGTLHINPPNDSVADWPIIGEKVHAAWTQASSDLATFINNNREMLSGIGRSMLGAVSGLALGILQFAAAIAIAGVSLANSDSSSSGLRALMRRLVGDSGDEFADLTVATVRSVALGVLGIAFIQAALGGIGMLAVGVPGAGLWALLILVFAIAQLPPILILGPVAFYVFSVESTTISIIFLVYAFIVSICDTFLKPLLLGRGVEAPMLVILLGAIGGMLYAGIIGLFLGAVVLAVGYKLMLAWLNMQKPAPAESE